MSDSVAVAIVAAVPATIAALASWRANKKADAIKAQVTPSNGVPTAKILEQVQAELRGVKDDVAYHVTIQHGRGPLED